MKLLCGPDWQDLPLADLIAAHPELDGHELSHLIAYYEEEQPQLTKVVQSSVVKDADVPTRTQRPTTKPRLAIEGKRQESAEEWIVRHIDDMAPIN
jgi:hypothetical protein